MDLVEGLMVVVAFVTFHLEAVMAAVVQVGLVMYIIMVLVERRRITASGMQSDVVVVLNTSVYVVHT